MSDVVKIRVYPDRPTNSTVSSPTMSNFCVRYLKNNTAIRTISNIFKTYKKSCENFFKRERIKRNQSAPNVTVAPQSPLDNDRCKPKSEVDLTSSSHGAYRCDINDWNNTKFDDTSSQESINMTWYNSNLGPNQSQYMTKQKNVRDPNLRDKLRQMPVPDFEADEDDRESNKSLDRTFPWQNFNIDDNKVPKYEKIKEVESLTNEMLKIRKSILRKSDPKIPNLPKEVTFNKTASMLVYPKTNCSVMKQHRINLSTTVGSGDKPCAGRKRKVKDVCFESNQIAGKLVYGKTPSKRNLKGKEKVKKCTTIDPNGVWYFSNKKQRIF